MHGAAESYGRWGPDWRWPAAVGPVRSRLRPPGSKSVTSRALVLAALAGGPTVITNPLQARDTLLMAGALRALGSVIEDASADTGTGREGNGYEAGGRSAAWRVTPGWLSGAATVDVGNAGTVLRFVPPAAALARGDLELRGHDRIAARPVGPPLASLRQLGAVIHDQGRGAVPFTVRARGGVTGGTATPDPPPSPPLASPPPLP